MIDDSRNFNAISSIVLIGCGERSEWALRKCLAAGVDVVSLVDPNLEAARRRASRFVPQATIATDLRLVRASHGKVADGAIVCAPPSVHGSITRDALVNGMSVYCEKPLSMGIEMGQSLADFAATRKLTLMGGYNWLNKPGISRWIGAVKQQVKIQQPWQIHATWRGPWLARLQSKARLSEDGITGGVLADSGVHVLRILFEFADLDEVTIEDVALTKSRGGNDVSAALRLRIGASGRADISLDGSSVSTIETTELRYREGPTCLEWTSKQPYAVYGNGGTTLDASLDRDIDSLSEWFTSQVPGTEWLERWRKDLFVDHLVSACYAFADEEVK